MSEVAFARSGEVDIAYRVVGDGPIDLVYVQGAATHLDTYWELPAFRRFCERLGEFTLWRQGMSLEVLALRGGALDPVRQARDGHVGAGSRRDAARGPDG